MTGRICEECGKHFISEMLMDKVEDIALILAVFFLPLFALSSLVQGWSCLIKAPLYIWLTIAAVKEIRTRNLSGAVKRSCLDASVPRVAKKRPTLIRPAESNCLRIGDRPTPPMQLEQTPPSEELTNSSSDQAPRTAN